LSGFAVFSEKYLQGQRKKAFLASCRNTGRYGNMKRNTIKKNVKAKAEELFSEGMYYFMGGGCDDSKAMACFDKAIKLDGNHYWAYYAKGMALFFMNNLKEAEKYLKKVVKLHKTHAVAWSNLSCIQEKLGKRCEAKKSQEMAHLTNKAHNEEIKKLNRKNRNRKP
jgi:tetratricopeptide (TPR) repeat protein